MSNNIAVKITADVVDLQSKFGTARAELAATEAEFRKLARASAAGTLDAAGQANYAQLTQRLLEQRSAVRALSGDLAEAGVASSGFGRAAVTAGVDAERAGVNISSMTRFTRELFDEVSSGRTRYLPSTLAELANQGFHLKPAMLFGYGGVAVLAAGLGYLAYKSIEAQNAIQGIAASAAFLGNTNVSSDFAGQLVAQIKTAGDVGEAEAEKTARAITGIENLSNESMSAIAGNIGIVAQALGTTTDKAAGTVAKILNVNTSVSKLQELLPGLTATQVEQAKATQQTGDYASILTERWRLLTSQLEVMQGAQKKALESRLAFAQSAAGQQDVAGKAQIDNSYIYIHQLQEQHAQIEKNIALTQQMAAHPLGPQAAQNQLKGALDDADKLNAKDTERKQIVSQIHQMEVAILHANAQQKAELEGGIAAAREKLAALNGGGGESSALEAAQEAASIKHQLAEQEIRDATHTLDAIAAAQEQARTEELAAAEQVANTKHQMAEREIQDASQTLKEMAQAAKQEAKEELTARQVLARDLEMTENNLVQNIVSGRRTLSQSILALGQELVAQEIQQDLKAMTTRLLLYKQEDAQKKALEQGGILYHELFESRKTGITVAGEAARTAATAAGEAQRWAIKEMAEVRATALKAMHALERIGIDAMEAAAGAFKAMVSIPYVGPVLAVAAAAAAIIEVKKFASFDVGAFNVPQDVVARVHAGEMILPRPFAEEARAKGFLGGGGGDIHHHGDINVSSSELRELLNGPGARDTLMQAIGKGIRNGHRP